MMYRVEKGYNMQQIKDYIKNAELRHKLNDLTRRTFCFDFEDWVTGGWYEGDYIPYSLFDGDKLASNASVNKMTFVQNGELRNYIQIGTVMTDEKYRGKGLARMLIQKILEDYRSCDGVYLFGNLTALGFYRKLGFGEIFQYKYEVKPEFCTGAEKSVFLPATTAMRQRYIDTVKNSAVNSSLEHANKFGLQMFYTADLSDVYYAEDIGCFAVMERSGNHAELKSIVSRSRVPLKEVVGRIGADSISLGFSPCADDLYMCSGHKYDGGDDYRLFFKGEKLKEIETENLYFPELSHA